MPSADIALLLAGALAGSAHVALAPDHLMGLLVFSAEARERAWRVGLSWGVGHAAAIVGVALLLVQLRQWLHWEFITRYSEHVSGLILVAIGFWGLRHVRKTPPMSLVRASEEAHWKGHSHSGLALMAGFADGVVHSVAGNGALLATLPAVGLGARDAYLYLGGFAVATIAGLLVVGVLLGLLSALPFRSSQRLRTYRSFLRGVSLSSVALGVLWLVLTAAGYELHLAPTPIR